MPIDFLDLITLMPGGPGGWGQMACLRLLKGLRQPVPPVKVSIDGRLKVELYWETYS